MNRCHKVMFILPDFSKSLGVRNKVVSTLNKLASLTDWSIYVGLLGEGDSALANEVDSSIELRFLRRRSVGNRVLRLKPFWGLLFEKEHEARYFEASEYYDKIKPDIVFIRELHGSLAGLKFMKRISSISKVIVEINSDLLSEIEMLKKRDNSNVWRAIGHKKELRYKPKMLHLASGFVGVAPEVLEIYKSRYGITGITETLITNGVDYNKVKAIESFDISTSVNCIFLAGAGDSAYKIQRGVESLRKYKGQLPIRLSIIGMEAENEIEDNYQIIYSKKVSRAELDNFFENQHFGISTLGLYQKGISQGSTLKVRDYFSKGLPVLLGYDDVDVPANCPYVFRVPNDDSAIDFNEVVSFMMELNKSDNLNQKVRSYFSDKISMEGKAIALKDFLTTFLN
jgi:hypothetical protein